MAEPNRLISRLGRALGTAPSRRHLLPFAVEAAWLLPLLLFVGSAGGLVQWRPTFDVAILKLAGLAIIIPSLGEELLFRAAILPAPTKNTPLPLASLLLSIALFVAWHPIQAFVFGPHWARIVLNPWFLAAVVALGLASARLYWKTGSLWPSVGLHWLTVVGWKALLAGPSPWGAG